MEETVCIASFDLFEQILIDTLKRRLSRTALPAGVFSLRSPVCMIFVRHRADQEEALLRQAVTSFDFWNKTSGSALDIVLPGWDFRRQIDDSKVAEFELAMQERTTWTNPDGYTTALVFDCAYDLTSEHLAPDFSQVMVLPVGEMIASGRARSLDQLVARLVHASRASAAGGNRSGVWEISDGTGLPAGARQLWAEMKTWKYLAPATSVISTVSDYAVRDLRRDA